MRFLIEFFIRLEIVENFPLNKKWALHKQHPKRIYSDIFWRRRVRIELTRDANAPYTGFEDQEAHQLPNRPQKDNGNIISHFLRSVNQIRQLCIACSLSPASLRTSLILSSFSGAEHQASPQPAEITLGTGIILPGTFFSSHKLSIFMASVVLLKVTTIFASFALIYTSYGRITRPESAIVCAISYMLDTCPT